MTIKPAHKEDDPKHAPGQVVNNHEIIWTCYKSGQMTPAQLFQHMQEDQTLADYIARIKARSQ